MISPVRPPARRIPYQRVACPPQFSFGCCVGVLVLLLLTSCSSASTSPSPATLTAKTQPSPASTSTPPATPITAAGPSPVLTPLAPPPQDCTLTPPPQEQTLPSLGGNSNVHLVGGGPFWIYGFFYQSTIHLGQFGETQWPITKIVVEVGPNYAQPVTLRLHQLETGVLAWWTDAQTPPGAATQTLILDPQTDNSSVGHVPGLPDVPHGSPSPGWKEWGLFPLFSVAGCYALEVSWAGGSWQSILAVGN